MFGVTLPDIALFLLQASLAVAGASCLWGFTFALKARTTSNDVSHVIYHWTAQRLTYLLYASAAVGAAIFGYATHSLISTAHAHEGIRLIPSALERVAAYEFVTPLFLVWIIILGCTVLLHIWNKQLFHRALPGIFFINLLIAIALVSFSSAWTGEFSREKVFFILHNAHSILTLGTVIVLDYLFLSAKSSRVLQRHIIPFFPWISKAIWVGLGLDFASVALIFPEALSFTPNFFFAQTVVGILIINGVLLAGPITRRMMNALEHGIENMQRRWVLVADISGTISIASWTAITFVDFLHDLTLSYWQLLATYAGVILVGFSLHWLWQWLDRDAPLLPHEEEEVPAT